MKEFINGYMMEAKWAHEGYIPTTEEHMELAFLTSGNIMLTTTCFVGMGNIVTDESFKWAFTEPSLCKDTCAISRLMNDIVTHKVIPVLIFITKKLFDYLFITTNSNA